jgi:GrpB-like predicted nucleotidyltransferase (UPF0157 family)/aminoglycoside phosphotransferase (APT) family kinase protein
MTVRIDIVDYNPAWREMFDSEKAKLLTAIGDYVAAIEHIGSTGVPGLGAKPVIDIMIGVRSLAEADKHCVEPITGLGYDYVKAFEKDTPFRRYFRKNSREGNRTHQIHLVEYGSDWWKRHLAFRDYLRVHVDAREAYAQLKRDLATREFGTVSDYANAKSEFIKAIEAKALTGQRQEWHSLDHASAATLLARHLPDADHAHLEPLGHGDLCLAFKLGQQVIRVARHLEAAAALRREACVLSEIAAMLPLPIPRLTYRAPRDGPPFTVHDEIVGAILTRDAWENMPAAARKKAVADLASFLRALHALPIETGLKCGLTHLDATGLARRLRAATAHTIRRLLDRETQRQLDETLERWSLPSPHDGPRPVLLHCDIAPGHLLYDPRTGHLTGVIDFGDIAIGESARDFIYVYEDYGPTILMEVLSHYAGQDAPAMLSAIRKWYLLEAIAWTVERYEAQHHADVNDGLAEITRELATAPARW